MAFSAASPIIHHAVVDIGPQCSGLLYGILPRHPQCASGPSPATEFFMDIKRHDMGMRVVQVVSCLVMNCGNITGYIMRDCGTKRPDKGFTLFRRRFNGKSDDKALTNAPLSFFGLLFRRC